MPHATFSLGRLAGVKIGAHWSVAVIGVLLAYLHAGTVLPSTVPELSPAVRWTAGVVTATLFLASLLAHELTHALVARHYGIGVDGITLWMLGGGTAMTEDPSSPRSEWAISAAGPGVSLAIGGGSIGIALLLPDATPAVVVVSLVWLGWTNVVLAVFNLLPAAPLDGGRVLHAIVWKVTGDRHRARTVASKSGQALGFVLAVFGLSQLVLFGRFDGLWLVLIGWYLGFAAQSELTGATVRDVLGKVRVADVMSADPVTAPGWYTVQGFVDQVATGSRYRVFPVVGFDGHAIGVVSLGGLAAVRPDARTGTRVEDVCVKPPACLVLPPDAPLTDVVGKTMLRPGRDLVLVAEHGVLRGVLSPSDLTRALELAALTNPALTRRP
ncbi:site-2 protease family protein [Amycolatopsis sp. NPDC059657]|uniref:site-2 protease family protein n=1 Tax=Amycolatopsis sp. NPDC059657 TaxID=3346899 RepID=UPI0036710E32